MAGSGAIAIVVGNHDQRELFSHTSGIHWLDKDLIASFKWIDLVAAEAGNRPFHALGILADDGEPVLSFSGASVGPSISTVNALTVGVGGVWARKTGFNQPEDAGDERG